MLFLMGFSRLSCDLFYLWFGLVDHCWLLTTYISGYIHKESFDRAMLILARLRWVIFFEISSYCDFYYVYIMGVTRQGIRINVGRDILPYVD
jgi:hypothetical protein